MTTDIPQELMNQLCTALNPGNKEANITFAQQTISKPIPVKVEVEEDITINWLKMKFPIGKYKDKTMKFILSTDLGYAKWAANTDSQAPHFIILRKLYKQYELKYL